jgi:hypothetical protein
LLDVSSETFRLYADRYGYELVLHHDQLEPTRHPAWSKVCVILDALSRYELVFWVDADAAIVDASRDVADELAPRSLLGLVAHEYEGQQIPNCGVMVVRNDRPCASSSSRSGSRRTCSTTSGGRTPRCVAPRYELEPTVRLVARPDEQAGAVPRCRVEQRPRRPGPHPRATTHPGRSQEYRLEHLRADVAKLRSSSATRSPGRRVAHSARMRIGRLELGRLRPRRRARADGTSRDRPEPVSGTRGAARVRLTERHGDRLDQAVHPQRQDPERIARFQAKRDATYSRDQMTLPSRASMTSGSEVVATPTMSAQPVTGMSRDAGSLVSEIQRAYAGFSSSGRWCSTVG